MAPADPALPLHGGFIQIDDTVVNALSDTEALDRFLGRLHGWRMDTLIVQRLAAQSEPDGPLTFDLTRRADDPLPRLLERAGHFGLSVFLGLVEPALNSDTSHWTPQRLEAFLPMNTGLAGRAQARYGTHAAWQGWYIPLENWLGRYPQGPGAGASQTWPEAWQAFFAALTAGCKGLNGTLDRPVAISPCLPGENYDLAAHLAVDAFAATIADSGIDLVLLQDSVGAKPQCWTPELAGDHLEALKELAVSLGSAQQPAFEVWANLEIFETGPGATRHPCSIARLKRQVANSRDVPRRLCFDLFHYLNDQVRAGKSSAHWAAAQKLARDYDQWLNAPTGGPGSDPV